MNSLVQSLGQQVIGKVEAVYADRIEVVLDTDAPQATALNTGSPRAFPRINGYVLVPNESGATVGVISSVRVERAGLPKRKGRQQDVGIVDLPFPSRVMSLTPLGTLRTRGRHDGLTFRVRRGVDVFPSVGDPVFLPGVDHLRAIVEGEDRVARRILIGHCPTAGQAPVHVDPDKLFGRHLAILGNTGAGKSCSVAGLIRWSLDAAKRARRESSTGDSEGSTRTHIPNARFIVLDPNGEYARAFKDLDVRVFRADPGRLGSQLQVPGWLWNGAEWAAFTGAAPGVQRPILFQALRRLRGGSGEPDSFETRVAARLHKYRNTFRIAHLNLEHLRFPSMRNVRIALESAQEELIKVAGLPQARLHPQRRELETVAKACGKAAQAGLSGTYDQAIPSGLIEDAIEKLERAIEAFGLPDTEEVDEDIPRAFNIRDLPAYVEALAGLVPGRDLAQFVDTLNLRIRSLLSKRRLTAVLQADNSASITLESWLEDYVGANNAKNGAIAIVDLSLVPSEMTYIVVSVLGRMILEALQRYRQQTGQDLPTTLVLDEAHTFVHRDLGGELAPPAGRECAKVFNRIAREGRKFGLGLVLASQRPSEVSATVLSQCNTFLLHRLVNDRDQELVKRLVPDGLGHLLRELPSLPTRRAILLGWATPAPTLVEVREVPEACRPNSPDPAFWDVWTGQKERRIDWERIARRWQRVDQD